MYDHTLLPVRSFSNDPSIDLHAVEPLGEVNLRKAFVNGAVEGSVAFNDEAFNGVQDPSDVLPRPKDGFERIRQGQYVRESLRAAQASAEAGHTEGA